MLEVAEEVAEVDVEELPVPPHHYVVVVPVPDAEDVGGDRVGRAGLRELPLRLAPLLRPRVVPDDPLEQEAPPEGSGRLEAPLQGRYSAMS